MAKDKLSFHASEAIRMGMHYGDYMAKFHPTLPVTSVITEDGYKVCPACGKVFFTSRIDKKYCSEDCRIEFNHAIERRPTFAPPEDYALINCGALYYDKKDILKLFLKSNYDCALLDIGPYSYDSFTNCLNVAIKKMNIASLVRTRRLKGKIYLQKISNNDMI